MQRSLLLLGGCLVVACSHVPDERTSSSATLAPPPASAAENYSVPGNAGPEELARLALLHHPAIAAARHRAERLASRVPQDQALPDPMLEVGAGSMAETAAGRMEAMAGVKQKIPFPGKRREAAAASASEAAAARAEIDALQLQLTEQVHSAWWDLYLADQTLSLTRESRSVLEAVRDAVDARVAADQASQADQLRLANELSLIDRDLAEARQLRGTASARLNSLLNRPAGSPLSIRSASPIPSPGSLQNLLAQAQARHPDVAAAEQRANAFRHRLKRAELEKYPDFTAGVTSASIASSGLSKMANGRDQLYATLGVNLPLWQEPRRAMLREAREGMQETEALLAATRSDLRYRVEEAWFQAQTAREVSDLFSRRLVPDARQAYDVTLTGYSAGLRSFNDLIETWRQHLAFQLQRVRNQAQLGKATATLRAAAGLF
ncbi:outer membrane protein TolC [Haloferula luteola]|uniref:Outer membrane protein TolC n=1 Tax=Haloferula luteola TaxID=595692 RepID=A0A840VGQ7_9BACT|nr:TolC family protein [Haloferula luteola]MBB5353778.1 outer membrane protein TolC [Haloferula luteola]